ncbi:MAG: hypothetical protein V5A51_01540 [Bacteroidales bacterium]
MVLDYWRALRKILLALAVTHSFLVCGAQELKYPSDKEGNATTRGVVEYIEDKDSLINEQFDEKFEVNSYDVNFVPDAMSKYSDDTSHQGFYFRHRGERTVIIDTVDGYGHYSLQSLPEQRKDSIRFSYNSLRGLMIHEKAHAFFNEMKSRLYSEGTKHYYTLTPDYVFSKSFIEEGVAQYCAYKMGEIIIPERYEPSDSLETLFVEKASELEYEYSLYYLKDFLDFFGLEECTKILLTNPPPTKEEIINPLKFYQRLEHYNGLDLGFFPKLFKNRDFRTR